MAQSKAWNVFVEHNGCEYRVDTIWFDARDTADEVLKSVVEHDGYSPAVYVRPFEANEVFLEARGKLLARFLGRLEGK